MVVNKKEVSFDKKVSIRLGQEKKFIQFRKRYIRTKTYSSVKLIKEKRIALPNQIQSWGIAGGGNFQHTIEAKYRNKCGKIIRGSISYCNKFDCSSCFLSTSFTRAEDISYNLLHYKNSKKRDLENINHIILSPNYNISKKIIANYESYKKVKKTIYKLIKDSGIFSGVLFFHLWSISCKKCGLQELKCNCADAQYFWRVHPHFHIIGYGYLVETLKIREYYQDWVIINVGRRESIINTAYYLLSHVSIWRKKSGRMTKAYHYFGEIQDRKVDK